MNLIRNVYFSLLGLLVALLPRAVDRAVRALVVTADRLERVEGYLLNAALRESEGIQASYARQSAAAAKERAVRAAADARIDTLTTEVARAARIRNRVRDLLA
jgi:hypothetical protein